MFFLLLLSELLIVLIVPSLACHPIDVCICDSVSIIWMSIKVECWVFWWTNKQTPVKQKNCRGRCRNCGSVLSHLFFTEQQLFFFTDNKNVILDAVHLKNGFCPEGKMNAVRGAHSENGNSIHWAVELNGTYRGHRSMVWLLSMSVQKNYCFGIFCLHLSP